MNVRVFMDCSAKVSKGYNRKQLLFCRLELKRHCIQEYGWFRRSLSMVNIMNLQSIFLANGVGIFILLILRYVSRIRIQRAGPEDKIFAFMVFGVMIGCFFEAFSYAIDGKLFPGSIVLNYIANTYLFTINLLLPLALLFYVDLGLYEDPKRLRKLYLPQKISAGIMFVLNIVNLFVPLIYRISEQNTYSRMPLSYVFYILIIYYCTTAVIVTKRYEKSQRNPILFQHPDVPVPDHHGNDAAVCLLWSLPCLAFCCHRTGRTVYDAAERDSLY